MQRADGSSVLLHFHKNGKCDPAETLLTKNVVPNSAAISEADGIAYSLIPAITHVDIKNRVNPGDKSAPLGQDEASVALQRLLIAASGTFFAGAINITDEVLFPMDAIL